MTADERIEALLNRAGQTISDLPEDYDNEKITDEMCMEAARHGGFICFALHLTDIIDRLELVLENVIGERDYLLEQIDKIPHFGRYIGCGACTHNGEPLAHDPCLHCSIGANEAFEFAGVPEDWSADDAKEA